MRYSLSLLCAILNCCCGMLTLPLAAQQCLQNRSSEADTVWLDLPMHDGDVLVHERDDGSRLVQRHRYTGRKMYWVGLPAPHILDLQDRSYSISIAPNGNVLYSPSDFFGSHTPVEYYPAFIPMNDSVMISNSSWRVEARFDTTIFSTHVSAYALRNNDQHYEQRLTIADKFGVVLESGRYGTYTLQSAVIDGVTFNRDSVRRRIFPLCDGSTYIHARAGGDGTSVNDTVQSTIARDTLIDGQRYLWFELPAFRTFTGDSLSDLRGWFRETEDGLLSADSSLAFPAAADIGDATPLGVITEIFQREYNGIMRTVYVGRDIGPEFVHLDTLVEGIGVIYTSVGGFIDFPRSWRLIGGTICGESWGIPLAVSETPVPPEQPAMQLYPNPAPVGTDCLNISISGIDGDDVWMSLHDLLGRELRNQRLDCTASNTEYAITIGNLRAGIYVVRVQTKSQTASKNLLLMR